MTDQSNPAPKIPRKKNRGAPATVDLPATVVGDEVAISDPGAVEAERIREAVAIEMGAPVTDESMSFAGSDKTELPPSRPPAGDLKADEAKAADQPPRRSSYSIAPIIAAALLGGVVGAGLLYALEGLSDDKDDSRLVALEQRIASLPQAGPQVAAVQGLTSRVQALETARAANEQRLAAAQSAAEQALSRPAPAPDNREQAAVSELTQRLSGVEGQLQNDQKSATEARAALATRVEDLSKRVSQGPDDVTKATVRAVLAQRLEEAVRLGAPYPETIAALRANGADASRLAALEPFAEKGAPTAQALARSFEPLASTILRDDRAVAGSFTDRLLRMADRVVTIRPVDEPGSGDVASLLARIQQALDRGNVQEAVSIWETLPEPARRLSEEWAARAKARAAADAAARTVAAEAVAALSRPAQ